MHILLLGANRSATTDRGVLLRRKQIQYYTHTHTPKKESKKNPKTLQTPEVFTYLENVYMKAC